MEILANSIKKIFFNLPPILKIILLLKKNKLLKNVTIKKLEQNSIVIVTKDYNTFTALSLNKKKLIKYINEVINSSGYQMNIKDIKIINSPQINVSKKINQNKELLEKVKQVKEKIYGHK